MCFLANMNLFKSIITSPLFVHCSTLMCGLVSKKSYIDRIRALAVVTSIKVNVSERNVISLVKEGFLSYLQEVYSKMLYVQPKSGKNV